VKPFNPTPLKAAWRLALRVFGLPLALALGVVLTACKAEPTDSSTQKVSMFQADHVVLDVVTFNYSDREIFDIFLNRKWVGSSRGPISGGGGIIAGVTLPLGPQTLTWRDAGTGKTFTAKNSLTLTPDQIPKGTRYLGVHIYPDETAELTFSADIPEDSSCGLEIYKEHKLYGY
jgi:hypothetical protein